MGDEHIDTLRRMLRLGELRLELGRTAEAEALLDALLSAAVRADERAEHLDPKILDALGRAYQLTGRPSKAIEIWTRALDLLPEGSQLRAGLAARLRDK